MEGTEKPFLKGTLQHKKVSHLSPRALCLDYSFYISPVLYIKEFYTFSWTFYRDASTARKSAKRINVINDSVEQNTSYTYIASSPGSLWSSVPHTHCSQNKLSLCKQTRVFPQTVWTYGESGSARSETMKIDFWKREKDISSKNTTNPESVSRVLSGLKFSWKLEGSQQTPSLLMSLAIEEGFI